MRAATRGPAAARQHRLVTQKPLGYERRRLLSARFIDMWVLVIGGTGSFSTRITQKSLERGHEVAVYARGRCPLDSICFEPEHAADLVALFARAPRIVSFREQGTAALTACSDVGS
jgi:hypothetical protein